MKDLTFGHTVIAGCVVHAVEVAIVLIAMFIKYKF